MDELQNQQNQQMPQEPLAKESFINKKIIIIVIVIVVLLLISLGVWSWQKKRVAPSPFHEIPSAVEIKTEAQQDTTSAINNDLNSINVESIDDSFKEIDADLNNL